MTAVCYRLNHSINRQTLTNSLGQVQDQCQSIDQRWQAQIWVKMIGKALKEGVEIVVFFRKEFD